MHEEGRELASEGGAKWCKDMQIQEHVVQTSQEANMALDHKECFFVEPSRCSILQLCNTSRGNTAGYPA